MVTDSTSVIKAFSVHLIVVTPSSQRLSDTGILSVSSQQIFDALEAHRTTAWEGGVTFVTSDFFLFVSTFEVSCLQTIVKFAEN